MSRLIQPFAQFFNSNGSPLSSGTLTFYTTGTTNKKDTYSDPDLSVVNANPIVLDGDGRCRNVYGENAYTIVLKDRNGVQIDQFDNVINTTNGDGNGFLDYDENATYDTGDIVTGSNGEYYRSLIDSNTGNSPASFPEFWENIRFIGTYNSAITYDTGDIVRASTGNLYKSVVDTNLNNDPASDDGSNWQVAIYEDLIEQPTNTSPADSDIDVGVVNPTLTASAYSGTGVHISSQWQIATDSGFSSIVYNSGFVKDLESHDANITLNNATTYYWRVRYLNPSHVSEFSDGTSFVTQIALSELFRIDLYTGNGTTLAINSGLDFSTLGGLTWIANRNTVADKAIGDTEQNTGFYIRSTQALQQVTDANSITAYGVNGFTVGSASLINTSSESYTAWQFLQNQGFFDVVSYTGTGSAQSVSHGLNATVGLMAVKRLSAGTNAWSVWFKDMATDTYMQFNSPMNANPSTAKWDDTAPTTTEFTVGTDADTNTATEDYIAYLWAHNPSAGIYIGEYAGTGATGNKIVTGFDVGYLMVKRSAGGNASWLVFDYVRGLTGTEYYGANIGAGSAETTTNTTLTLDSDGFTMDNTLADLNASGSTYSFIAIANPTTF